MISTLNDSLLASHLTLKGSKLPKINLENKLFYDKYIERFFTRLQGFDCDILERAKVETKIQADEQADDDLPF